MAIVSSHSLADSHCRQDQFRSTYSAIFKSLGTCREDPDNFGSQCS